jgi:hypothetical protein
MEKSSRQLRSKNISSFGRRAAWTLLLVISAAVSAMISIPVWLIQPFRHQEPQGLELAYTLRQWSPLVTLIASAIVLVLMVWLWQGARRWWSKAALVLILVITLAADWLARQNHFEWMFNPLSNAAYTRADEAYFIADHDMVLAVELNGDAVAYPVRQLAYHHIVQDGVGGVPVAATY